MDHSALCGRQTLFRCCSDIQSFRDSFLSVCTRLVGWLELRWGSGEEEVQQGAVGDQVTHSWTAGYQLTGLKQQRPGAQNIQSYNNTVIYCILDTARLTWPCRNDITSEHFPHHQCLIGFLPFRQTVIKINYQKHFKFIHVSSFNTGVYNQMYAVVPLWYSRNNTLETFSMKPMSRMHSSTVLYCV